MRSDPSVTGFWYFEQVGSGDGWWAIEGRSLQNVAAIIAF